MNIVHKPVVRKKRLQHPHGNNISFIILYHYKVDKADLFIRHVCSTIFMVVEALAKKENAFFVVEK